MKTLGETVDSAEGLDWVCLRSWLLKFLQRLSPTSPVETLEELVQESLVSLFRALQKSTIHDPQAWLGTVSRRKVFDLYRRNRREKTVFSNEDPLPFLGQADRFPDSEALAGAASIRRFLERPEARISDRSREWVHGLGRGMTRAELARDYDCAASAVTQAMQRIAAKLVCALN